MTAQFLAVKSWLYFCKKLFWEFFLNKGGHVVVGKCFILELQPRGGSVLEYPPTKKIPKKIEVKKNSHN